MGIAPFSGNSGMPLFIYTLVFFAAMLFLVLNPGQLVNRIGKFITPVLLAALLVLGGAAIPLRRARWERSTKAIVARR